MTMTKISVDQLITEFGLERHPEGGFFKQTFCSQKRVDIKATGDAKEEYAAGTSILFLLKAGDFSAFHRLHGHEETWNYHAGSHITLVWINADGELISEELGLGNGAKPQVHVPENTWFAAYIEDKNPDAFCLVGCTVFQVLNIETLN